jgi:hypothetical protein
MSIDARDALYLAERIKENLKAIASNQPRLAAAV